MLRAHPIYSHFNIGRKDSVIYYSWHDIPCVRRYTKPRNPRTHCQQSNRNLHAELTRLSGVTKEFRRFCFDGLDSYRSSHTAFIGMQMCQMRRVSTSTDKPLEGRLRWGVGTLPGARELMLRWKDGPRLKWEGRFSLARWKDQVLWIAYNATRGEWQWSLNAGMRRDGECLMKVPDEWKGDRMFLWLLFYDPDKKRFSCDICLQVKEGCEKGSCRLEEPELYTRRGLTFDSLVQDWCFYRTLDYEKRKEFREAVT